MVQTLNYEEFQIHLQEMKLFQKVKKTNLKNKELFWSIKKDNIIKQLKNKKSLSNIKGNIYFSST